MPYVTQVSQEQIAKDASSGTLRVHWAFGNLIPNVIEIRQPGSTTTPAVLFASVAINTGTKTPTSVDFKVSAPQFLNLVVSPRIIKDGQLADKMVDDFGSLQVWESFSLQLAPFTVAANQDPRPKQNVHAPKIGNVDISQGMFTVHWESPNVHHFNATLVPSVIPFQGQVELSGLDRSFTQDRVREGHYIFSLQGCISGLLKSICSGWVQREIVIPPHMAFQTLRVGANAQDKWVLTMGNRIMVIVNDGRMFVHEIANNNIGRPFRLVGPRVAANPQDRRVVVNGNRIAVILTNGDVFVHEISGNNIGLPFKLVGPPVATNSQDKWVLTLEDKILVIVADGRVFAHEVTSNNIGIPFQLVGPAVAKNGVDKWVVVMGNRILVITNNGGVFVHEISGNTIGVPFQLVGPPVATNSQDKLVLTIGNRILVVTKDGGVFVHEIGPNTIGSAFKLG
ncbi:MAG: hypothetical protein WKF97_19500 [Chitinophagaceae bacterium]